MRTSDQSEKKNFSNRQTEIGNITSDDHTGRITRLKIKNDNSSKLLAHSEKEFSKLGDELKMSQMITRRASMN